jgi:hypothetical protein
MTFGKGIGIVAVRPIPKGTLILQEPPLFLLEEDKITAESVKEAVSKLEKAQQREFMGLKNSRRGKIVSTMLGIFKVISLYHLRSKERTESEILRPMHFLVRHQNTYRRRRQEDQTKRMGSSPRQRGSIRHARQT